MKTAKQFFKKNQSLISIILLLSGFVVYFLRSLNFAQTIPSTVWDEGMYIFKGFLFTSGKYTPFEDFGVWTNQMPLSYFVAGLPQVLAGPGFRTGRYFAVVMGGGSLLGLGLAVRRLRGNWWAAAVVWVVALNQGWVMAFSQMFSQSMVSFFLAWMIFFLAGKRGSLWEVSLAALFASMAGMVRINLLPVLVILVIFAFWRYGIKFGFTALLVGILPILVIHLAYWPDILKIWAYWIPESIYPGIADYRSPWREVFLPTDFSWFSVRDWWGNPDHLAWTGIQVFFDGLRANLVSWFGVVVSSILWPRRGTWQSEKHRRLALFFVWTYLVMFAVHVWAAMGGKTCQFSCFPGYFLFFNWFGLMAVVMTANRWKITVKPVSLVIIIVLLLLIFGFQAQYGNNHREIRSFILIDLLGISQEWLMKEPGAEIGAFWQFLDNSIGIDSLRWLRFVWLNDVVTKFIWVMISVFLVLGVPWVSAKIFFKKELRQKRFGYLVLVSILILAGIGGSTKILSQPMTVEVCSKNVIDRQELVGEKLASVIPAGSQVFWDVKSNLPLFYLPEAELFLPQLNGRFTMIPESLATVGENQKKARFGWWDYQIGLGWIEQADYIVVQNQFFEGLWGWKNKVEQGEYDILMVTAPLDLCTGTKTELVVLQPNP